MTYSISNLIILLNEHPQVYCLTEIRIFLKYVCHIQRRANQRASRQRFYKCRSLKTVKYLSNTLNSLNRVELCNICIHSHIFLAEFNVRSEADHIDVIFEPIVSCFAFTVKLQLEHVLRIIACHNGTYTLIKEKFQLLKQGKYKAIFIRIEAFLLNDVQHSLRSYFITLYHSDHICMLSKMSYGFGAYGSDHFYRNDLFFIFYVTLRCSNDRIKRYNTILDHFHPGKIYISLYKLFIERYIAISAFYRIHKKLMKFAGGELTKKAFCKTVIIFFYLHHSDI